MYIVDRKWTELAAGYQSARGLQARLEKEFGRAVRTGYKIKYRRDLTEWQKKRRVFFSMAALAPLSLAALCLTAFYFRDVACVIVYWAMLVLVILVTLAVAGRQFIREAVAGRPVQGKADRLAFDLERRWWEVLAPAAPEVLQTVRAKKKSPPPVEFLTLLKQGLPQGSFCMPALFGPQREEDGALLVLAPSGLWLLETRDWRGTIRKADGVWKTSEAGKRKPGVERQHPAAPDAQWLARRDAILAVLARRLPQHAWTASLLQGGVVFTDPQANPAKAGISGNSASFGPAGPWLQRLRSAPPVDGFTTDLQLELLDALVAEANLDQREGLNPISAKEAAEQVYRQAADEIHQSVEGMVR